MQRKVPMLMASAGAHLMIGAARGPSILAKPESILQLAAGGGEPGQFYTVKSGRVTYVDVPCEAGPDGLPRLLLHKGRPQGKRRKVRLR